MKKTLIALLTAAVLFSLTACGNAESTAKTTDNSSQTTATTTAKESAETTEASPFKTNDKVSLTFSGTNITLVYKGTPEAYFYDYIDTSLDAYVKLFFSYEVRSYDNAGVFMLAKDEEGNISTLLEFGDYQLKDGELTFGENGFPMTCVFTGTEEEVEEMYSAIDMKGTVIVNDSLLQNNYSIAYVKDVVTKE
jgi:hypothetical protein